MNDVKQLPGELTNDDKTWGMLAHLSVLLSLVIGNSFVAPLIIWLIKKDSSPFVDDQAKEALNFQLSVLIVVIVSSLTCIGIPIALAAFVASIVYGIIGGMAANRGELYRYPYTFRMIN